MTVSGPFPRVFAGQPAMNVRYDYRNYPRMRSHPPDKPLSNSETSHLSSLLFYD